MEDEFLNLIEKLRSYTIVIIENDFIPINNIEEVVSKYFQLNSLNKALIKIHHKEEFNLLNEFELNFKSHFTTIGELEKSLLEAGKIKKLIEGKSDLNTKLNELKEKIIDSSIYENFLNFGIFETDADENYNIFFKALDKIKDKIIINIFKNFDSYEENFTLIKNSIEKTNSNFCLFIIDEVLGRDNLTGTQVEKIILDEFKENSISIIYSSNSSHKSNESLIEKGSDPSLFEKINHKLYISAYQKILTKISESHKIGIQKALELSKKNTNNIINMLEKSKEEGITSFEAINNWFTLAKLYYQNKDLVSDFKDTFSLVEFLNKNLLDSNDLSTETIKEVQELSSFEIFDYNINKKHLPPMSGDIFYDEETNELYFLVGQACDLSIREKGKRKLKLAELIKIDFKDSYDMSKPKISHIQERNNKIRIQNLKLNERFVEIEILINNHLLASFDVIDLCMFNEDGECSISLKEDLNNSISVLLPDSLKTYYSNLKDRFKKVMELEEDIIKTNKEILSDISISIFNFHNYDKGIDLVEFKLKRICRVKDNFNSFINKIYFDHKGRIDLNTIKTSNEKIEKINLNCIINGEEENKIIIKNINLFCKEKDIYIKKDFLLKEGKLDNYKSLLELIDNAHITKDTKYFTLSQNKDIYELNITLAKNFKNKTKEFKINGNTFKIISLLEGEKVSGNIKYFDDTDIGDEKTPLNLSHLKKGIKINEYKITLEGGVIDIEKE